MAGEQLAEAHIDELQEVDIDPSVSARLAMADLAAVPVTVGAELGRARMSVRDILDLKVGSLVTLTKNAGEPTDITVNGMHFAKGEVVVIGDALHVRVADVTDVNNPMGRKNV